MKNRNHKVCKRGDKKGRKKSGMNKRIGRAKVRRGKWEDV